MSGLVLWMSRLVFGVSELEFECLDLYFGCQPTTPWSMCLPLKALFVPETKNKFLDFWSMPLVVL